MAFDHTLSWKAEEYFHQEKTNDWYWGLGIVAVTAAVLAVIFGNTLFGLVIVIFAFAASMQAHRKPRIIDLELTRRGIVIHHVLYPYATLESFWISDEHDGVQPKILIKSKKAFMPFIHLPLGDMDASEIRTYLLTYLKEEELEESILEKLFEYFGF